VFYYYKKKQIVIGIGFGRTGLCIILDRHAAIKSSMAQIFPELIGYY
jgi:hypothetical protein